MKIDKKLIQKVAKNARLNLTSSEIKEILPELKEILNNFEKIKSAPTSKIKPSFQPIEIKNITRQDKTQKPLTQQQALKNSKHKQDGYFKGPKAI